MRIIKIFVFSTALLTSVFSAASAQVKARGTSSLSNKGTGETHAYKRQNFTEQVAVATGALNYYPNDKAAFQVGGDTLNLGFLPPRVNDTSDIAGSKPKGLTAYFYKYLAYGTWNGNRWIVQDLKYATYTFKGTGVATVVFAHHLGYTPTIYSAIGLSTLAKGIVYYEADTANITLRLTANLDTFNVSYNILYR